MMKGLLELIPFLNGYPVWVRAVMIGLPPLYAFAFVLLSVYAPPLPTPALTIDTIRWLNGTPKDVLGLDVFVHNPMSTVANITDAIIEFYTGQKPDAGLSSALTVSATYRVEKTDQGLVALDGSAFSQPAQVVRPYVGQSYTRVTVPLAQQVKSNEGDRFVILLHGSGIVEPGHDRAELTLGYNDGKKSASSIVHLK